MMEARGGGEWGGEGARSMTQVSQDPDPGYRSGSKPDSTIKSRTASPRPTPDSPLLRCLVSPASPVVFVARVVLYGLLHALGQEGRGAHQPVLPAIGGAVTQPKRGITDPLGVPTCTRGGGGTHGMLVAQT